MYTFVPDSYISISTFNLQLITVVLLWNIYWTIDGFRFKGLVARRRKNAILLVARFGQDMSEKVQLQLCWIREASHGCVERLSVSRLPPASTIPSYAVAALEAGRGVVSITKTEEEISIVSPSKCVPADIPEAIVEHGWVSFKVDGQLDFALIGILSCISTALQQARISIFALSTYNTDYILIKEEDAAAAEAFLNSYEGSMNYRMSFTSTFAQFRTDDVVDD